MMQYVDLSLILDSGDIYSWGHGGYGQLGHGTCEKTVPVLIKTCFGDRKVLQAACGSYHSIALTSNGEVCQFFLLCFFFRIENFQMIIACILEIDRFA